MRPFKLICSLLLIILLLTACVGTANDLSMQIVPPKVTDISIGGTWEVVDVLNQSSFTEEDQQWLGKPILFSSQYGVIADYFIKDISYQVKRVNADEYLLYHYKAFPEGYHFSEEEIEVITIMDQDVLFAEILREHGENLILKINNDSFILKMVSQEVDEELLKKRQQENSLTELVENSPQSTLLRTGVFIGLRQDIEENQGEIESHLYRTLWIASENKDLYSFLETENIFFPRRKGFWKMEINRVLDGNRIEDLLVSNNILSKEASYSLDNVTHQSLLQPSKLEVIYRKINYISNDYVSIEEKVFQQYKEEKILQREGLHILAIDSLPNIRRINILDLLGSSGLEAIETGRKKILEQNNENNLLLQQNLGENFGLERRFGHWFLKGRVNFHENDQLKTSDYNINLIPPSELVFYDDLSIPWTTVKDRVPAALDLYTSPNKDIALVVTKDEIMVFSIKGRNLQLEPLERIPLKDGEVVIMTEWATGLYVESWQRTFENYVFENYLDD